ncbi:MAG: LamG-like jellyroll fold domain-containing protein [Geminicoccaceae bacterium]
MGARAGGPLLGPKNGGEAYAANSVLFDGTTDYLERGADLTGSVDTNTLTFSVWLNYTTTSGVNIIHLGAASEQDGWRMLSSGSQLLISGRNSSNIVVVGFNPAINFNDGAWHHFMGSFTLSSTSLRHFYIDGANAEPPGSWTTYTDDTMDLTRTNHFIGSRDAGATKYPGDMSDLMIWFGTFVDLSILPNRELFIKDGKPVNPDISTASLGTPIIKMTGPTDDWHTNKGSGGGFIENGALTDGNLPVEL